MSCRSLSPAYTSSLEKERTEIMDYAKKLKGSPYKYAGSSPKGFDCSGYVSYVFSNFGYKLPRSSHEMMKAGERISEKDAKPGDLIFFKGRNKGSTRAGHVGIVTEVHSSGTISFIHSATSSGVRIDNTGQEYYKSRYLQVKRVIRQSTAYYR